MKKDALNHMKVKRLKRLLGIPLYQAVGILESLWLTSADSADDGGIGRFTNQEIADGIEWDGDADFLIAALVEAKWLDHCEESRLAIHDWLDHAPEYIRDRIRKRNSNKIGRNSDTPRKIPGNSGDPPERDGIAGAIPVLTSVTNQTKPNQTKHEPASPEFPPVLRTEQFKASWNNWEAHRKEIKAPLKPTMVAGQLKMLAGLGHDRAIAMIEHTIAMGWQGLREPESKPGSSPSEEFVAKPLTIEEIRNYKK